MECQLYLETFGFVVVLENADSWGFKDRPHSSMVARLEGLVLRWLGQQLTKTRTDVLWPKPMECQWHNLTSLEESVPICSCWLQQQNATGSHRSWGLQIQRQRGYQGNKETFLLGQSDICPHLRWLPVCQHSQCLPWLWAAHFPNSAWSASPFPCQILWCHPVFFSPQLDHKLPKGCSSPPFAPKMWKDSE